MEINLRVTHAVQSMYDCKGKAEECNQRKRTCTNQRESWQNLFRIDVNQEAYGRGRKASTKKLVHYGRRANRTKIFKFPR